ncbi:hydrogenase [Sulfurimonas sp.]|uniref:hydrogenase n=1 Tax=Sulfurimonas sp. TaxID=2022749 RepID=UPI0026267ACD|nr:hydrogenase [Sulfurimonas sp.]
MLVLEYKIDYRSSSQVYEKIFLKTLQEFGLEGKIFRDGFLLQCYVAVKESAIDELEVFVETFSKRLPYSIFLHKTEVVSVVEIPKKDSLVLDKRKVPLPFCLDCLADVSNEKSENYYNIFTACKVCGYDVTGEAKNYKKDFVTLAQKIKEKQIVQIDTFYGRYNVGLPCEICNSVAYDLLVYDYATVKKYTDSQEYEYNALASFEKPLVKLKTNLQFKSNYDSLQKELLRFKLPDDFILHLLMEELHKLEEDILFITQEAIAFDTTVSFFPEQESIEPIEVVVSEKNSVVVKGEKGIPEFPVEIESVVPAVGALYSIIKEHKLKDENIVGIYLSKEYNNSIIVYGKKYGVVEYLSLRFTFQSIAELFEQMQENETAARLLKNYREKFPELYEKIITFSWEDANLSIYRIWGIIAIILGYSEDLDIIKGSQIIENNNLSFLGKKGPRIDYKLEKINDKVTMNPLLIIQSAMSFRLAGVDELTLSYGIMESFVEFLSNELDTIKNSMGVTAVAVAGSLLENKKLFARLDLDCSINHQVYYNNELPVDGRNIFYGDSPKVD